MIILLFALCLAGIACCSFSARYPPGGALRVSSALVTSAMLIQFPINFTSVTLRGGFGFIFAWLASFKLLSFAVGRGPLATQPRWGLWRFVIFCLLPVYPDHSGDGMDEDSDDAGCAPGGAPAAPASDKAATKAASHKRLTVGQSASVSAVAVLSLTFLLQMYSGPLWSRHCLYALHVWLMVTVLLDSPSCLAAPLLGALHPGMNAPFASSSIRDFWGRRYNLIVSRTLRDAVYQPILDGSLYRNVPASRQAPGPPPAAPSGGTEAPAAARKVAALFASFAVSGVMHQAVLWYMCGKWYGGMLAFFLLQPPLIAAQEWLYAAAPQRWCHSWGVRAARTALTLGVLLLVGEAFFWGPFDDCGADKHLPREIMAMLQYVRTTYEEVMGA